MPMGLLSATVGESLHDMFDQLVVGHRVAVDDERSLRVERTNPIKRLGLHAHELMFIHPLTHKEMRFISKTPASFQKLFKKG